VSVAARNSANIVHEMAHFVNTALQNGDISLKGSVVHSSIDTMMPGMSAVNPV